MCVERVHRIVMAAFLTLVLYLTTLTATMAELVGYGLGAFMIVMLLLWGFFNFCPALKIFGLFLPKCDCDKK